MPRATNTADWWEVTTVGHPEAGHRRWLVAASCFDEAVEKVRRYGREQHLSFDVSGAHESSYDHLLTVLE